MKRTLIATLTMLMLAGTAIAQERRGGGSGRPGGPEEGVRGGGNAIVASDGTIFVTRRVTDSATGDSTTQLVAVRSTGATAWSITLTNGRDLQLSGSNLLTVSDSTPDGGAAQSTISAIATATGASAWSVNIPGRVTDLEPFSGGTYVIYVTPPAAQGGSATRSLAAVSNSGAILWTVAL